MLRAFSCIGGTVAGGRPRAHARPPPPRGPLRDLVFKPRTASVSTQRAAGRRRVRTVQSVHAEVTKRLAAYRRGEPPPWGPPSRLRRVAGCRPLGMCVPAPAGAARTRPHQALPRPFQAWGPFAEAPAERGAAGCGVRDEPGTARQGRGRVGRSRQPGAGPRQGAGRRFPRAPCGGRSPRRPRWPPPGDRACTAPCARAEPAAGRDTCLPGRFRSDHACATPGAGGRGGGGAARLRRCGGHDADRPFP